MRALTPSFGRSILASLNVKADTSPSETENTPLVACASALQRKRPPGERSGGRPWFPRIMIGAHDPRVGGNRVFV